MKISSPMIIATMMVLFFSGSHAFGLFYPRHPAADFFAPSPSFRNMNRFAAPFPSYFPSAPSFVQPSFFSHVPRFSQPPSFFKTPTIRYHPQQHQTQQQQQQQQQPMKQECDIKIQETPRHTSQMIDGDLVVKFSMPNAITDKISLEVDGNTLSLKAPYTSPSSEPSSSDPSSSSELQQSQLEKSENVQQEELPVEVPQGGLVVSDVEEEEEQEASIEQPPSQETETTQKSDKCNGCKVTREYVFTGKIPKNTNKDLISAKLEEGDLYVHFPSLPPPSPARAIPIQ